MTHVGVAVCPGCGARFAVAPHTVGLTRACPSCGTLFKVQPVAAGPPLAPFTPPKVDLAAGAPPPLPTRALTPTVYPYRSWIPQGGALVATVVGVLCVLVLILGIGGKIAYDSIMASLPITKDSEPSGGASHKKKTSTGGAAANLVDRLTEAASALSPSNLLSDTHASCAAERDQLEAEAKELADRFRDGIPTEEAGKELFDLLLRIEDLAIRWHQLPPMTETERQAFADRYSDRAREEFNNGGPPRGLEMNFDASFVAVTTLFEAQFRLSSVIENAAKPTAPPEGPAEESYEQVCRSCREACRRLYAIRTPGDVDDVRPAIEVEIEKVKAAEQQVRPLASNDLSALQRANLKYVHRLSHEQDMVAMVARHVVLRHALKEAGGVQPDRVADPALTQRLQEFATHVSNLQTDHSRAVSDFTRANLAAGVNVAIADPHPRVFAPQVGGPFAPDPDFSLEPRVAEARQSFSERFGPKGFVQINIPGGSFEQWQALQTKMQQLSQSGNFSSHGYDTQLVGFIHHTGDLDKLVERIDWGRVTRTDSAERIIEIEVK